MSPLFRLPRELRDIIYDCYIRCDGGYIFNAETQKFRRADGGPIFYALALTCRQAASELEGLALQINPLAFTVSPMDSLHKQAALQDDVTNALINESRGLLVGMARKLFTKEMREHVAEAWPMFAPYVELWLKERGTIYPWGFYGSLGEAPSVWRDFQHFVAKLISGHPAFYETANALPANQRVHKSRIDILNRDDFKFEPWRIISMTELERLSTVMAVTPTLSDRYHPKTKFTYSAAALALQFLDTCTSKNRNFIRKIILIENDMSGAKSECHGRGFIPFCRENRNLQVERRVNFWKTTLMPASEHMNRYTFGWEWRDVSFMQDDRLHAKDVTQAAGTWITETMALPSLGMPEGSYTLVFDGDPTPRQSSNVFRTIQRDAAWQAALDTCYSRGLFPEVSWLDRRRNRCYIFEGLPEAMQMLLTGSSLMRCNFDLGAPYDIEDILEKHRGYDWKAWHNAWPSHEPSSFQTEPPLPPWHELCWLRHYYW